MYLFLRYLLSTHLFNLYIFFFEKHIIILFHIFSGIYFLCFQYLVNIMMSFFTYVLDLNIQTRTI